MLNRKTFFIALVALAVVGAVGFYFFVCGKRPHQETIYEYSRAYGVDPFLSLAVAEVESGFDEEAVSKKGAIGVMQLMPATAQDEARDLHLEGVTPRRLRVARININLGVHHLGRLTQEFKGDPVLALAAWNAGTAPVKAWLGAKPGLLPSEIPYVETRNFVKKVLLLRRLFTMAQTLKLIQAPQ